MPSCSQVPYLAQDMLSIERYNHSLLRREMSGKRNGESITGARAKRRSGQTNGEKRAAMCGMKSGAKTIPLVVMPASSTQTRHTSSLLLDFQIFL